MYCITTSTISQLNDLISKSSYLGNASLKSVRNLVKSSETVPNCRNVISPETPAVNIGFL